MSGLVPLSNIIYDFRKSTGEINAGGTLEFFDNLTLTPKDVFNGYGSSTILANPLQLNASGFEPGVWLGPGPYRIRCRETAPTFPSVLGPVIWTKDYVNPNVVISIYSITTPTTLTISYNGAHVSSTSDITVPAVSTAGAGWNVNIKNVSISNINIVRTGVGDTINDLVSNFVLPPNESIQLVVNAAVTGYDLYANGILQAPGANAGSLLTYGLKGPEWASIDIRNIGGKLYAYTIFK
jgi:hypothetical protein